MQLAKDAEQFARGAWRFLFLRFEIGLADQVAQMLAVGRWMFGDHQVERAVALRNQAIAQVFEVVQCGGFTMRLLLADVEDGAHGVDFRAFQAAQEFGEVLGFAFAGDRLVDGARAADFIEQVGFKRDAGQLRIGQRGECFRQLEDGGGIAAQLAAAGAVEDVIGFIVGHRISAGSGHSRCAGTAFNG